MPKKEDRVIFAYCQTCKEKTESEPLYILSTGKVRTLRGKCKTCGANTQLVVGKRFQL